MKISNINRKIHLQKCLLSNKNSMIYNINKDINNLISFAFNKNNNDNFFTYTAKKIIKFPSFNFSNFISNEKQSKIYASKIDSNFTNFPFIPNYNLRLKFSINEIKNNSNFRQLMRIYKKHFCDTISFGDDLNKLINIIERADIDRIPQNNIRNFCIIAHIDHGKSTLSDRLLEKSGAINKLEKKNSQILDTLKVERERGITVKAQTATMIYKTTENEEFILNLIDTPGHVDFSYEVIRSLRPCQGALLLVDASKGVQAQTLSNFNQAKNLGLKVIPVINKIDMPTAHIESTLTQMENTLGFSKEEILLISAKNGINLEGVFDAIIKSIPAPNGDRNKPLR